MNDWLNWFRMTRQGRLTRNIIGDILALPLGALLGLAVAAVATAIFRLDWMTAKTVGVVGGALVLPAVYVTITVSRWSMWNVARAVQEGRV